MAIGLFCGVALWSADSTFAVELNLPPCRAGAGGSRGQGEFACSSGSIRGSRGVGAVVVVGVEPFG